MVSSAEEQQSRIRMRRSFWKNYMGAEYGWVPANFDEMSDDGGPHTTFGGDVTDDHALPPPDVPLEPGQRVRLTSKGYEPAMEGLDVDSPRPLGPDFDAPLG